MTRTPEQKAADDALTAAIEAVQAAYDDDPIEGVLTAYIVIAKRRWWEEDDAGVTSITSISKDNALPVDEMLGLAEYAAVMYRDEISSSD
ncbi:hypothetical protein [Nocardia gipuzkoensis]